MSYGGRQYSCNPFAFSEYLEKHCEEIKLIWSLNDFGLCNNKKIVCVKPRSFKFYYYCIISHVIVTNGIFFPEIPLRKKQIVINTWHGGGAYKKVVFDNPSFKRGYFERKILNINNKYRVVFLSSCKLASKYVIRSGLNHTGKILEIGSPRNDILFNKTDYCFYKNKVFDFYQIQKTKKVLLYAPTFRDSRSLDAYNIDFEQLLIHLNKRFSGDWIVLLRLHPIMAKKIESDNIIDASAYPNMQELLIACSAFITDYSSSMWDFSFTLKPGFIYASDLSEYKNERDFYTKPSSWPFSVSTTNKELFANIDNFSYDCMYSKIKSHLMFMGSFENGDASKRLFEYIENDSL